MSTPTPTYAASFYNDGREEAFHKHIMAQPNLTGSPDAVLDAMNAYISTHKRMITLEPGKIRVCRSILEELTPAPKLIVELGGYMGVSAIAWGAMLKAFHASEPESLAACKVYTCEFEPRFAAMIRAHVELAGLSDVVEVLEGKSSDSLKQLKADGKVDTLDMLFLDHWKNFYLTDTRLCEELGLFRTGSVILADNTDAPGAPDYLAYVRAGGKGSVRYETKTYESPEEAARGHPAKDIEATTIVAV